MAEIILNLHMHTRYSDGGGLHADIAKAALRSGVVDAVLVTDHNVYVHDMDRYYEKDGRKILLLVGEEVHDQAREPQKNHLLVFNANREVSTYAHDPQLLIDQTAASGGLSFLAHPVDLELADFHEDDISWVSWDVKRFTGIELWNGFSELKSVVKSKFEMYNYIFFPETIAHGPLPETLDIWDGLLNEGRKVVAIGGSDAHAMLYRRGFLKKVILPYEFHFHAINTHLITPEPLTGNLEQDKAMIYTALEKGHCFIGYDLPALTRGFRFTAQGMDGIVSMGDEIKTNSSVTFQIKTPMPAHIRLLRNGELLEEWTQRDIVTFTSNQVGVFRVEVYISFLGKERGWIFSNPITIKKNVQ